MIEIVIKCDDKIVGRRDKNAFDLMDCLSLLDLCISEMFEMENVELQVIKKYPKEPTKDRTIIEGM